MVDTTKERDELHRAIWAIADELRGAVDGWDFKNYVLGTMFYRYISENLTNYINEGEIEAGNAGFDYAKMPDADAESAREGLVEEKGFFILPSELFCNVLETAPNGTAAMIVCFPGIMYRCCAKKKIRKYLIDNNFIDCIIQLPSNLFFGTSIATCIMVLKKGRADNRVLFIDATDDFIDATGEFVKVTNNNKLTPENIDRIVGAYAAREEEDHFAHLAGYEEIVENDYNLSVSTYVEKEFKDLKEIYKKVKKASPRRNTVIFYIRLKKSLVQAINGKREVLFYYKVEAAYKSEIIGSVSDILSIIAIFISLISLLTNVFGVDLKIISMAIFAILIFIVIYAFMRNNISSNVSKYKCILLILNEIEKEMDSERMHINKDSEQGENHET